MKAAAEPRKVGLARALSKLGVCSRSQAVEFVRNGRVRLNGAVRRDPETPVRENRDRIAVDGAEVGAQKKIYIVINKPRGVVTTASDEKGRETVYDTLAAAGDVMPWLAPVGRLDKASEGLLLMTNDSEWGARIAAPESHLDKTYHVQINTVADDRLLMMLGRGITDGGDFLRSSKATVLRLGEKNSWLEIVLEEGKNRQIRRMLNALDVEVLRLVRVRIGPLELGNLAKGAHRLLTSDEKRALDEAMKAAPLRTTRTGLGKSRAPRPRTRQSHTHA